MNGDFFIKLKEFVVNKSGVDEPIDRTTRIQEDLGVSGDDAVEFILSYSKEFNVDVTNFMAADYFETEGGIRNITIPGTPPEKYTKIDKEVLRVMSIMPRWEPGRCSGVKVPVRMPFRIACILPQE